MQNGPFYLTVRLPCRRTCSLILIYKEYLNLTFIDPWSSFVVVDIFIKFLKKLLVAEKAFILIMCFKPMFVLVLQGRRQHRSRLVMLCHSKQGLIFDQNKINIYI